VSFLSRIFPIHYLQYEYWLLLSIVQRAFQVPVTATKSQVGHMLGAAGAISALAAVKTIEEGVICPTINYETPDPECDLDYVPNEARKVDVNLALINAFGFGGQDVVLVLGKYHEHGS